ncbi:polyamine ABC transporter substrate-binding protein [Candidatus Bipolaricaulota bacterium]|nr:polyamine ABC transporter substrate-binding protein [Candidatus Bipolaricaulota bacterium]
MYRKLFVVSLALTLIIGVFASGLWAQELAQNQVLRIALDAADLSTLDPHRAATTPDRAVVDMIFNGLVRYKPGDISVFEPDLAVEIPEPTEGGLVWAFELKKGVMVHPWDGNAGYELTAEDVVYSLTKAANSDRSSYAGEYVGMTFEAVDNYTVKITLENPLSAMLFLPKVADYAGGFIVPKKPIEEMGDDAFKTHPVGTGPFMLSKYVPMDRVVLKGNADYFRGAPILETVEVRYMPEVASRELGLRSGELEVVEGRREQDWVEMMEALPGIVVDSFGPGETVTLHFNLTREELKKKDVRKAIAYALDRDEFLAFFGSTAEALYSPVPVKYLAGGLTYPELWAAGLAYDVDREAAKALLAKAGYPNGFTIEAVTSERASYRRIYEQIQAQLREVGITLDLRVVDHSTMHSMIRDDVNPMVIYIAWRPNADVFLTRFYHSDSIVVTGAKPDTNFSHYTGIDDLIEAARGQVDADMQIALWKEAQRDMTEYLVSYPLIMLKFIFGRSEKVDWGYELKSTVALYTQVTENTRILK